MSLETDFFLGYIPDIKKLISYGFKKKSSCYTFSKYFMEDDFQAEIKVSSNYHIYATVYDSVTGEEYLELKVKDQKQLYVQEVKEAYLNLLQDIRDKTFIKANFLTPQANRVCDLIKKKYATTPCFMWKQAPNCGVFKHDENDKWYGIIQNLDFSKLDEDKTGLVEILNLKLDEKDIPRFLKIEGIYPAWHMNKKYWISIILNETLNDQDILKYIDTSFILTKKTIKEWIIPANPSFFDLEGAFKKNSQILWKQSSNIHPNDIVYMYVASPYSAIMYKCKVTKTDLPYKYSDKFLTINKLMEIKLLRKYDNKLMDYKKLKKYGVTTIRGPRSCPQKICSFLSSYETKQSSLKI